MLDWSIATSSCLCLLRLSLASGQALGVAVVLNGIHGMGLLRQSVQNTEIIMCRDLDDELGITCDPF